MAKLIEAQSKSKKTDSEIASQGTENALKMEELKTNLATRQLDLQKEQVIHAADAEKSQLDAAKVKADIVGKNQESAQKEIDSKRSIWC
jgi:hypothetical protein